MATATLKMDDSLKARISQMATVKKRSAHSFMLEGVIEKLEREEKRERFLKESLAAWEDFKETGLHVTQAEMDEWLDSWGTAQEKEPPKCHK